jgi:hypothetical protein
MSSALINGKTAYAAGGHFVTGLRLRHFFNAVG